MNETISIRQESTAITVVTLGRPESANALNTLMAQELAGALVDAFENKACRVILLTGAGKHFCAGADLKERKGMSEKDWHIQHDAFEKALHSIMRCPIPVIAAVNGAAMGGGLELALACDFIYAATTARFALTETTLGIIPGLGGGQTLARAVGTAYAKELIFTGKPFSAGEAFAIGMVNTVFSSETLMSEALTTARTIASNAPLAVRAIKQSINQGMALPLKDALVGELAHYRSLLSSKDRHEGINAWGEKRKPAFTGE